jgi:hypothetical protein
MPHHQRANIFCVADAQIIRYGAAQALTAEARSSLRTSRRRARSIVTAIAECDDVRRAGMAPVVETRQST